LKTRYQTHHIVYEPDEWTVKINMLQHRTISRIQVTKATPEKLETVTNFMHALAFEWNRMARELATGVDQRVIDFSKRKPRKTKAEKEAEKAAKAAAKAVKRAEAEAKRIAKMALGKSTPATFRKNVISKIPLDVRPVELRRRDQSKDKMP
jgi:hypothetical protein